jgi:glyoxylase-like metal-dependent hydrolase (beta-lactamase superfamily II)
LSDNPTPSLQVFSAAVAWLPPYAYTDRPVLGAISGQRATLLVDAGNSEAHARWFMSELATLRRAPARYTALTHWHWDHVFGASTLNLPLIAHFETHRRLVEMAGLDWSDAALDERVQSGIEIEFCRDRMKRELPDRSGLVIQVPDILIRTQLTLDLGGITCQILPVGGDHSSDSTVMYVPEERFMFIGDCLSEDYYSGHLSYTTAKLFPLLNELLGREVDFYLEGHAPAPIPRQQMEADARFLRKIGETVDRIGLDRPRVLETLPGVLGQALDATALEVADAFLAGLAKTQRCRLG